MKINPKTDKEGSMPKGPVILFVCEHGAAKSIIAAAHFARFAQQMGLEVQAVARGTNPDQELSPQAVKGLSEDGLAPTESNPQALTPEDIQSTQRVVTFCNLPAEFLHRTVIEHWTDVPPVSDDYDRSRDAIVAHIKELIGTL